MAIRACTCGAAFRDSAGVVPIVSVDGHYRDCVSLLPDPDTCLHRTARRRAGSLFCTQCAKGLTEGGPPWLSDKYRPGYGEELLAAREAARVKSEAIEAREATYDLSGISLDYGITDLNRSELFTLAECCMRELAART